jgi:hypothetical protein
MKAANFKGSRFYGLLDFDNKKFKSTLDFTDATFAQAPRFHGCEFQEDTTFPPIKAFTDRKTLPEQGPPEYQRAPIPSDYYQRAAHAYRTLRLAMKNKEANDDEAKFWELELRVKRKALKWYRSFVLYLLSGGYLLTNAYGNSLVRPILWWFVATLLFAYIIYPPLTGSPFYTVQQSDWRNRFNFSLQQTVRPFAVWSKDGETTISDLLFHGVSNPNVLCRIWNTSAGTAYMSPCVTPDRSPFWIQLVATIQSVLCLTLVALFGFALRRKFRLP